MISLVAAVSKNLCIGKDNKIPWHIPEDFKYFKEKTMGNTVLMGQKTFNSILEYLGKPLPGRKNVVLTRDKNFTPPKDVRVFYSIDEAMEKLKNENVFVCGGASIYAQMIDKVDTLYITQVHQIVDGDTFFPEINPKIWQEVERDDRDGFSFVKLSRRVIPTDPDDEVGGVEALGPGLRRSLSNTSTSVLKQK